MYVISHFLNEELFLPHWLRHHVPMFDHGIMIDYGSTDRSVEIIRELAPHWEIRKTHNDRFMEPAITNEVAEIEKGLPPKYWKLVLNVTEFLVCADLRVFIVNFEKEFPHLPGFKTTGILMVDSPEEEQTELTDAPLVLQRRHGIVERRGEPNIVNMKNVPADLALIPGRCRFVHKLPTGHYEPARHTTTSVIKLGEIDKKLGVSEYWGTENEITKASWRGVYPGVYIAWFGRWSPFLRRFKERVTSFDIHNIRFTILGGRVLPAPGDTSILEKEIAWVRGRYYDVWEQERLYRAALLGAKS